MSGGYGGCHPWTDPLSCAITVTLVEQDSDRELLPADYVSAQEGSWRGSESQASFLLPLRSLPADVKAAHTVQGCWRTQ
uniref:Uncharacterized protein n=1 Tax=Tetradesmus obliquus TaxID=3088 RepID=A0A383VT67_TETOB